MSSPDDLLDVQLASAPEWAYAGQWTPITLLLARPAARSSSVRIKYINHRDRGVRLDTDLLQSDVEVRPGETYRLTVPIRVEHARTVALDGLIIQVGDLKGDQPVSPPRAELRFLPAIDKEITLQVEPLCSYEDSTKVRLTLVHEGSTPFSDLVVVLGPEQAIQAGKRILRRDSFPPGAREQVEIVIQSEELVIEMEAKAGGARTEARLRHHITRPRERSQQPPFRFLEPRRLSSDQKAVYLISGTNQYLVPLVDSVYPLRGGSRYEIVITPEDPLVCEIKLRGIEGVVDIRREDREKDRRAWKFWVDVACNDLGRKPERLFYDVTRGNEVLSGELHLCLLPPWGRYLRLAGVLGVAITLQGISALVRFLINADYSLVEAAEQFHLASHYQLLYLLSIPVVWGGLRLYDWLQYRLSS